jgi:K+-sensing histidine kinase KdpD
MASPLLPRGSDTRDDTIAGYAVGGLGPIAIAGALVPFRNDIEHTTCVLILVVVVVLAAMAGGRATGALGAIVAAASFDFFLTKPYLSLRIEGAADIETTVMLLVIGLLVGEMVVWAKRSRRAAQQAAEEIGRFRRVSEQAAKGGSIDDLVHTVEAELIGLLHLETCHFEQGAPTTTQPRLERTGALTEHHRRFAGTEFALPREGVILPVIGNGRTLGHLVMEPEPDVGVSLESRVVAVALADQLGAVLATRDDQTSSH